MDGEDLVKSVKADSIKKYYASRSIKKRFSHEFSL